MLAEAAGAANGNAAVEITRVAAQRISVAVGGIITELLRVLTANAMTAITTSQ